MILKSIAAATAVAVSMAAGGMSYAATFGEIGPNNDGLSPLGLSNPLKGWFGASLYLIAGGPVSIGVTVLGSEAGYKNQFAFGGDSYTSPGVSGSWSPAVGPDATWTVNALPGLLNFVFNMVTTGQSVANGSNPDGSGPGSPPNFFVSFKDNPTGSFGQEVYLFLDDGGAGPDDNHDDLVVLLSVKGGTIDAVPLPAAGVLLLGALGGLGALRRRKA